jgi:hypothetical protein
MTETVIIDRFEYKGREIAVHKDGKDNHYFKYMEGSEEITLDLTEMNHFISSSFSHTTIADVPVDMIEKSVKIKDLIYNLKDLKARLRKY